MFGGLGEAAQRLREGIERADREAQRIGPVVRTAGTWTLVGLSVELAIGLMCLGFSIYWLTLSAAGIVGGLVTLLGALAFFVVAGAAVYFTVRLRALGARLAEPGGVVGEGAEAATIIPRALRWIRAMFIVQIVSGGAFFVGGILGVVDGSGGMGGTVIAMGTLFLGIGIVGLFLMGWGLRKVLNSDAIPDMVKNVFRT